MLLNRYMYLLLCGRRNVVPAAEAYLELQTGWHDVRSTLRTHATVRDQKTGQGTAVQEGKEEVKLLGGPEGL